MKLMAKEKDLIPEQRVGNKLDTSHEYVATNSSDAGRVFSTAADRLLNVNNWAKLCGPLSANFSLMDERGENVQRSAKTGDYFRIDVPGPGPSSGDGFDWVKVEALEDKRNPDSSEESVTIRVRPSPSPENTERDTAHFFSEDATSSFRVIRRGNVVRAEVHGRNEVPNTDVERNADKVRNALVGSGAIAGISKPQWASLVKGLLDSDSPDNETDGTKI
jgi:hypothetical protein